MSTITLKSEIEEQPELNTQFTSTGAKLFHHQQALYDLQNGKGTPIVAHILPTDLCQYSCSFCSVGSRPDDALTMHQIRTYLDQLCPLGLRAVILSGGGNPLLYKDPESKAKFPELVEEIVNRGLELGIITNGVKLKDFDGRKSYPMLPPHLLDRVSWIRISLAGWDHKDRECFTPDVDPKKTTLGGSYVLSDSYLEPTHAKHGRVSRPEDIVTPLTDDDLAGKTDRIDYAETRLDQIKSDIAGWVERYNPAYVRALPNCLQPALIPHRTAILQKMAEEIDPDVVFCQSKPPRQPGPCYKGYLHPVLNCSGDVFSCDSIVLNEDANHQFDKKWSFTTWDKIGEFFADPIKPLVAPNSCAGCVFSEQVDALGAIVDGAAIPPRPDGEMTHVNFV